MKLFVYFSVRGMDILFIFYSIGQFPMGDLDFLDRKEDAFLYTNEICHLLEVLQLLGVQ